MEELGLTGPLRREEKEQLGAGPGGCGVQGQVQRHMDLGGIVEIIRCSANGAAATAVRLAVRSRTQSRVFTRDKTFSKEPAQGCE